MLILIRTLFAPLLSLFFMMVGSGLFNTFNSLRLEMEHISPEMIGVVSSALYLGILIGSFKIDRWISKVGHIFAFVIFAASLSILVLFQSIWINPWYWSFLRLFGGISMAGVFIVIESWLLMKSPPNMRGAALSIYLGVLYCALSLGQLLINSSDPKTVLPFLTIALLVALSIIPITIRKIASPKLTSEPVKLNMSQLVRLSPLGFGGGVISGMVLAVTYGLIPIFAKEIGMSITEVGTFMATIIFGGFLMQLPIGKWADRGDRRRVLKYISFFAALLSLAVASTENGWLLFILAFFYGGFAFTLYPVSMAYTCERVKENEIVAATGGFVLSYGIGAIAGPLLAPLAMSYIGASGIFYFLAFISLILGISTFKTSKPAPES
ncbi:MAG: MFS transporter [Parachlamydiales bacterium]|nr:MFS transporter [Parachlamydiales bacterium]